MESDVKIYYSRLMGIINFEADGMKYSIKVENDDIPGAIAKFYDILETGYLPGEAGMEYDSYQNENEKLERILYRLSKASVPTAEDIEIGERVSRELSSMTADDYFRPIRSPIMGEDDRKRKEQYDRMIELAKEFDKPIPDDVLDELELFSAEWEAASYKNMDRILM